MYDARYEKLFKDYAKGKDAPYGVTIETLAAYHKIEIDQIVDLNGVTKDDARRVHHSVIWQWRELYRLPDYLAGLLFSMLIETGDDTPIKELQGHLGVKETGRIDADFARRVKANDFSGFKKPIKKKPSTKENYDA